MLFLKAGDFFSSTRSVVLLGIFKQKSSHVIVNKFVRRSRKKKTFIIFVACYTCYFYKLVFYFFVNKNSPVL